MVIRYHWKRIVAANEQISAMKMVLISRWFVDLIRVRNCVNNDLIAEPLCAGPVAACKDKSNTSVLFLNSGERERASVLLWRHLRWLPVLQKDQSSVPMMAENREVAMWRHNGSSSGSGPERSTPLHKAQEGKTMREEAAERDTFQSTPPLSGFSAYSMTYPRQVSCNRSVPKSAAFESAL